jgi:hypothetical protein
MGQHVSLQFLEAGQVVVVGVTGYNPTALGIGQADVEAVETEIEGQDIFRGIGA